MFARKLVRSYRGRAKRSRAPLYDPVVILKLLVLAHLYDLSERQIEDYVNDGVSAKCLLGMAVNKAAPDHSTSMKFKGRTESQGKEALLEVLLQETLIVAVSKGVKLGSIQLVDSTHTGGGECAKG